MGPSLQFQFIEDIDRGAAESLGVVAVPVGLANKAQLMRALSRAVPLPDYFGGNWDALDECLRERLLEGPRRPLCLLHRDLPLARDARDCRDYLVLLNDTLSWARESRAQDSRESAQPAAEFTVVFPATAQRAVEGLLGPTGNPGMAESTHSAIQPPETDPTPIFEHFRGSYGSELLTVAVAHFNLFGRLAAGPKSFDALRGELQLESRPAHVLVTALLAMKLIGRAADQRLELTPLAREHLVPGATFAVSDYLGLAAAAPGVLEMAERLRTNRPAGAGDDEGAAFIYREGIKSAMESAALARHFTLALAGRAKNVAPVLAARWPLDGATRILDIGGGTGIYSIALLQKHPGLSAVVLDRAEVLKVAAEMAAQYGVADRLELRAGDMFADPWPADCQVVLLSNILHDWDVPRCRQLIARAAAALPSGGRLLIHDVFLHDDLDGPLAIALYSAALFTLTEGRAYSQAEYRGWMRDAGLTTGPMIPTLVHCGVVPGTRT